MSEKKLGLSQKGIEAIEVLRDESGTLGYYARSLNRVFQLILSAYEDLGVDATETMSLLRALWFIRQDLFAIAGDVSAAENVDLKEKIDDMLSDIEDIQG